MEWHPSKRDHSIHSIYVLYSCFVFTTFVLLVMIDIRIKLVIKKNEEEKTPEYVHVKFHVMLALY